MIRRGEVVEPGHPDIRAGDLLRTDKTVYLVVAGVGHGSHVFTAFDNGRGMPQVYGKHQMTTQLIYLTNIGHTLAGLEKELLGREV